MPLQDWREDLEILRQNWLLSESQLITFARDRGVLVDGVIVGEPGEFHRLGWLGSDAEDSDGTPRFHPFRLYVLRKILQRRMAVGSLLDQPRELKRITEASKEWNDVVDLATMLEPLYWPEIVGSTQMGIASDRAFQLRLERYRRRALDTVAKLDPKQWRKIHGGVRVDAGWMDRNDTLYALLRLSEWHERKDLSGVIGGALWIRHLAEVIRRGFEEAHGQEWPQEFHTFGVWHASGLKRVFGSARPLDDPMRSKPFLARAFGLFTGSSVRWYVEGETEYYAALEILKEPSRTGVELVNLRGNVKADRDNMALKLEDWLKEDKALRRFSMISFDRDAPPAVQKPQSPSPSVRAIRRQVEKDNVVGLIVAHTPDFEFANFSVKELAEIAARVDAAHGFSGAKLRGHDWTGSQMVKPWKVNIDPSPKTRHIEGRSVG